MKNVTNLSSAVSVKRVVKVNHDLSIVSRKTTIIGVVCQTYFRPFQLKGFFIVLIYLS